MDAKETIEFISGLINYYEMHQAAELITMEFSKAREIASLVEHQERMIEMACQKIAGSMCVIPDEPCPENYVEVGCLPCVRKWVEEAAVNG